jgi:hypothetical protein
MRILHLTAFVFLTIICNAQIGAKSKQSSQITGIWQNSQFGYQMTMMLNADGTGEFDGDEIKYTAKAGVLALTIVNQQSTTNYQYTLNGNQLTVSGGDLDQAVTFTRAGTGQQPTAQAPADPPAADPLTANLPAAGTPMSGSVDKALLGAWSGNGELIDFKPDGKVVYLGNTFQYSASQGNITLSSQQGSASFQYKVQGNQLILSGNGQQVTYTKGMAAAGAKSVPQELVGKWCKMSSTSSSSGGSFSSQCIILNGDGTYSYNSESSRSVNTPTLAGGTSSQGGDQGTWWVQGDRIYYNSQTQGTGSYKLEKRNHPKNVGDPMIVLDGEAYVTATLKQPWR